METQSIEKSQRINLGAGNLKFSERTNQKFYYFLAGLFFTLTILYIIKSDLKSFDMILSSLYLINASFFLFKAHFELSPTSKYAPHVIISDNIIKIKTGVFKKSQFINWKDVKKVELGYYKIGIKDKTGLQFYPYATRKETSIQIKRAIKDIANQKEIEVENLLKT